MVKLLQYLTDTLKLVIKRDKLFYYDMTQAETMLFDEECSGRRVLLVFRRLHNP